MCIILRVSGLHQVWKYTMYPNGKISTDLDSFIRDDTDVLSPSPVYIYIQIYLFMDNNFKQTRLLRFRFGSHKLFFKLLSSTWDEFKTRKNLRHQKHEKFIAVKGNSTLYARACTRMCAYTRSNVEVLTEGYWWLRPHYFEKEKVSLGFYIHKKDVSLKLYNFIHYIEALWLPQV